MAALGHEEPLKGNAGMPRDGSKLDPLFPLGALVSQYEGTLDLFSGVGIMVFFNDPVPCPDQAERAV